MRARMQTILSINCNMDKLTLITKFADYVERHRVTGMCSRHFIELQRAINTNTLDERRTQIIHTLQQFVNNLFFVNDKKQFHLCVSLLNKLFELCYENDIGLV